MRITRPLLQITEENMRLLGSVLPITTEHHRRHDRRHRHDRLLALIGLVGVSILLDHASPFCHDIGGLATTQGPGDGIKAVSDGCHAAYGGLVSGTVRVSVPPPGLGSVRCGRQHA